MSLNHPNFDTLQAHAGQSVDATGARVTPIYQTTSFVFDGVEQAREIFNHERPGHIYTRISNPTTDVLERRLAALEGGSACVCFASGMAAEAAVAFTLCKTGDEIVCATALYGGTHTLFADRLPERFGIATRLVDIDDFAAVERAINEKTRMLYFESIGNPNMVIPDIERLCQIAHAHGVPVVCDNTFGTPYLMQLGQWGVDIVVHSATKYIGGHGNSIGGAAIDMGSFPWKGNPRFADFNEPDPTNHDLVYADMGDIAFATKLRAQQLRDTGACLSPFNAFLLLTGVETLSLRVERHCQNALAIAQFLAASPKVAWVNYPALPGDKYHARQQKYAPKGAGGIFSFGLAGGYPAGVKFIEKLKIFSHLANVADAKSLVIHPASTTHGQLDEKGLKEAGVQPEMIRMSVGLEDVNDLLEDIAQALED